jgi:hypothetical protein
MPRLISKPVLHPAACFKCGRAREEFGPYLDTDHTTGMDERVVYCSSCAGELVKPLEVISISKFREVLAQLDAMQDVEHQSCLHAAEAREARERVERLEAELAGAHAQLESVERHRRELLDREKIDRKERLLAEAASLTPDVVGREVPAPKPKPTRRKAVA